MAAMTPRQRVLAVLGGHVPDQVPFTVYECMIPQCAVERRLRAEGLCILERRHRAHRMLTPNCTRSTHTWVEGGRELRRTTVQTPAGEISTVTEPGADGEHVFTSWTRERYFKGPDDYRALRAWMADRVYVPNYEAFAAAESWRGEDVLLRGYAGGIPLHTIMVHWMGLETFAVEWAERRDEVLALEAVMRESQRPLYRLLADSPISHANLGGNVVTSVMGRERFAEFCLPVLNECAHAFHARGKLMGTHLDGDNAGWADLVAGSDMDYVEAFTPAPDTDMTLEDALRTWPDKVVWINFPSSVHLATLEHIREVAGRIVELARQTSRVIIGITEDIPADRWQESLLAISDVIRAAAR